MMDGGMMDGMASMMAWMMSLGLLGWVLVKSRPPGEAPD